MFYKLPLIITSLLMYVSFLIPTVVNASNNEVGIISAKTKLPTAFVLVRQGEEKIIGVNKALYEGDIIRAKEFPGKNDEKILILSLNCGDTKSLEYEEGKTYPVENCSNNSDSSKIVGNFFTQVWKGIENLWNNPEGGAQAGTSGSALRSVRPSDMLHPTVSILRNVNTAKLIADKSELYISWCSNNRSNSYEVEIRKMNANQAWKKMVILPSAIMENTDVIETRFQDIQLTPGIYKIRTGAVKEPGKAAVLETRGYFTVVVPDSAFIENMRFLKNTQWPKEDKQYLLAGWLLNQGEEWQFEAYQQLSQIASASSEAKKLKERLEDCTSD